MRYRNACWRYPVIAARSWVTEYQEFPRRSHLIAAENGWEEVAEYALSWAIANTEAGTRVRRVA